MTKIDIISGFLGAGKTTLIKKLIQEAYQGEKVVLIENEFGEIGIDSGFLKDAGVQINEINSGCICCSLVGDFSRALEQVLSDFHPDRIVIEPSGVGKLSDVIRAVQDATSVDAELNGFTTVADVNKCKMYMKNFGEFYNDQIQNAGCIILSHTANAKDDKIDACVALLREKNDSAVIVTTDWEKLSGAEILQAMERKDTLQAELDKLKEEAMEPHHHHHDEDEHCHCHDEHHHDEHDHHCHHDHDHEHDEECHCHHHDSDHDDAHSTEHSHHDCEEHEHEHEEGCTCGCGGHGHHHHHAEDVFTSWGKEVTRKYTVEEIKNACAAFDSDNEAYGIILRAKGIVEGQDGTWIHFDYVPGEVDVRTGSPAVIGRLCVIGSKIKEDAIAELFGF